MGSEGHFPLPVTSVMRSQPIGAEDKTLRRKGNCKRHWAVCEGGVEVWEHTESCGLKLVGKKEQGETRWQRATLSVQRSQHSSVHLTPRPYAKTTMTWFTKENNLSGCLAENASGPRVETRWIGRLCEIAVAWIWWHGWGQGERSGSIHGFHRIKPSVVDTAMLGLCALMYAQDFKSSVAFLVSLCSYPSCFHPHLGGLLYCFAIWRNGARWDFIFQKKHCGYCHVKLPDKEYKS